VTLDRGTVVLVDLDPTIGHEQRGLRPCVIVSAPEVTDDQRFPLVCVIRSPGRPARGHFTRLCPPARAARAVSWALVDQLRSIDKRRLRRVFGVVAGPELEAIDTGLYLFLGIDRGIEA
jgi:mRNA interferase MazF